MNSLERLIKRGLCDIRSRLLYFHCNRRPQDNACEIRLGSDMFYFISSSPRYASFSKDFQTEI